MVLKRDRLGAGQHRLGVGQGQKGGASTRQSCSRKLAEGKATADRTQQRRGRSGQIETASSPKRRRGDELGGGDAGASCGPSGCTKPDGRARKEDLTEGERERKMSVVRQTDARVLEGDSAGTAGRDHDAARAGRQPGPVVLLRLLRASSYRAMPRKTLAWRGPATKLTAMLESPFHPEALHLFPSVRRTSLEVGRHAARAVQSRAHLNRSQPIPDREHSRTRRRMKAGEGERYPFPRAGQELCIVSPEFNT